MPETTCLILHSCLDHCGGEGICNYVIGTDPLTQCLLQAVAPRTVLGPQYIGLAVSSLFFDRFTPFPGRPEARRASGAVQLGHRMCSIGKGNDFQTSLNLSRYFHRNYMLKARQISPGLRQSLTEDPAGIHSGFGSGGISAGESA
jgi:hypothetical protein